MCQKAETVKEGEPKTSSLFWVFLAFLTFFVAEREAQVKEVGS